MIDESFIDDLGACFGGNVAAEIDVELARDLEIVGGPRITHANCRDDTATARDVDQWIGFGGFALRLSCGFRCMRMRAPTISRWLSSSVPMSSRRSRRARSSTQFQPWMVYCMAAASSPFAPPNCSRSMLPKRDVGGSDVDRVHEFLNVVIHLIPPIEIDSRAFLDADEVEVRSMEF